MPTPTEQALTATHYACNHYTQPGVKGVVLTAEKVKESLGRVPGSSDAAHARYVIAGLTRLIDLGAIVPIDPA